MKVFRLPQQLTNLETNSESDFCVGDQIDLESYDPTTCIGLIDNFSSEAVDSRCYELITDQTNFDIVYAFMKYFDELPENVKASFVGVLFKGGRGFVVSSIKKPITEENQIIMKNALYIYIYFISLLIPKIDKFMDSLVEKEPIPSEKGRRKRRRIIQSDFKWADYLYDGIEILLFAIRSNLKPFFNMGVPDDLFLHLFSSPCLTILGKPTITENSRLIEVTVNALASLLSTYPQEIPIVSSMLVNLLAEYEHLCDITANLCSVLYSRCNQNTSLMKELIIDLSKQNFSETAKSTVLIKNSSHFLTCASEQCPFSLLRYLPLLLKLLDREAYTLRLSILQCLGNMIEKTSQRQSVEQQKQTTNSYQDIAKRRASVVVRRQSMAVSKENEKEDEEEKEEKLQEIDLQTAMRLILLIGERQHDINAFVRAASLRVLNSLCSNGFIPLSQYVLVTSIALERLHDKAVLVRKNAMNLLTVLLENNPYESQLNQSLYHHKLQELEELISSFQQQDPTTGELLPLSDQEAEEKKKAQTLQSYYQNALQFTTKIAEAIPQLEKLLQSKAEGDVTSVLQFLPLAISFHIPGVDCLLRKILLLVWTQSTNIHKELIETMKLLFFFNQQEGTLLPANTIASQFIRLIQGATVAETTSFAELVPFFIKEDLLNTTTIEGFWAYLHSSSNSIPLPNKYTACYILSLIAATSPSLLYSKPNRILALKQYLINEDYTMLKYIFMIWGHLHAIVPKEERLTFISLILQFLIQSTLQTEHTPISRKWFEASQSAVQALFLLSSRFDRIVFSYVHHIMDSLLSSSTTTTNNTTSEEVEETEEGFPNQRCNESCLTRVFFVIGQMSLKLLQFVEETAVRAKKARHKVEEEKASQSKNDKEMKLISKADDYEDMVLEKVNKEGIVVNDLLSIFGEAVIEVIMNKEDLYGSALQNVAILTFCKFMTISRVYCEKHLNLLFTLLVRSEDENVRSNIMICIGDLCYRYPNQLEQWTNRIYSVLKDKSVIVRTNALSVLSHLILNDMIRVKGQISYLVLLLEDPSEHIQTLAKVFFNEWGKRGNNPVYNVLPECISSLLEMPEMTYEKFSRLMKYLFHFIDKDKQQEQLIDKLCQRMSMTDSEFKWKCLCYCLTCLSITPGTLSKYLTNKKNLKNSLHVKEVADLFWNIVMKIKRSVKPEQMNQFEELQAFVEECSSIKSVEKEKGNESGLTEQGEEQEGEKEKEEKEGEEQQQQQDQLQLQLQKKSQKRDSQDIIEERKKKKRSKRMVTSSDEE